MDEVLNFLDSTSQLNITKLHVKDLLKDFLAEMRGFKYQITLQIAFRKEIENSETKYSPPISYNSNTQAVIRNSSVTGSLETSFQRILFRI